MFSLITNPQYNGENTTQVPVDYVQLTDFSSQIDLVATYGAAARGIVVVDAGTGTQTLGLAFRGVGDTEVNRTLNPVPTGAELQGAIKKILTSTTVSKIWVYF